MTADNNQTPNYTPNISDVTRATIAETIIKAYNDSHNPPIIRESIYKCIKHTPSGYTLIANQGAKDLALVTNKNIGDFIEDVFYELSKIHLILAIDVENSPAVLNALKKLFDGDPQLSLRSYAPYYGNEHPSLQITLNEDTQEKTSQTLMENGFSHIDKNTWEIRL